jgi:hypothetical protein
MTINGFTVRFTINGKVADVSDALNETYLPVFSRIEDKEIQLWSALAVLADDLCDGGDEVDYSLRNA